MAGAVNMMRGAPATSSGGTGGGPGGGGGSSASVAVSASPTSLYGYLRSPPGTARTLFPVELTITGGKPPYTIAYVRQTGSTNAMPLTVEDTVTHFTAYLTQTQRQSNSTWVARVTDADNKVAFSNVFDVAFEAGTLQ